MMIAKPVRHVAMVLGIALGAACSTPPDEGFGVSTANLGARFDSGYPAPKQIDDWSCSVHTTTWMLRATGHDVTFNQVASRMKATGRVTEALGLMDSNGPGLAATLRDFAEGSPSIANQGVASFDAVAARAGHMAVGIGGRSWNHWSAVRGYDAGRDVILLANSAPEWKGAGQELTRAEFAALGAMAFVWMDFGQTPPPPPFAPSPRPSGGPFPALHVKGPIDGGHWITQCNESADGERVWQVEGGGPAPDTRWATAKYPQRITTSCGDAKDGRYPIVLRNYEAGQFGAWVTACTGDGDGLQRVYRIDAAVDGHPAASFQYNEASGDCE
jgi:hypothetical protein